ncbi:flagellar motor protein MotB [Pseudalkalibacillus berkeleyi]|uniref:Flagellar motor protein MotB n=1 Tax=Pseudalkalibacillus berkeleyi TaxID=1069813 RepID=A0ABS9H351_9BACL|nr:flagellar motor protein MotB [Pseudalkalibacillus berkeleyi]MCF6139377.1 flagellar motor protein MotB [Pseudalkalibacillus berkeleyi]
MLKTRKKKHEEHIDESWLIPYADMLTLLLALFIVLFAVSTVDAAKFENMANSFKSALNGGTGPLDYTSPVSIVEQTSIPTSESAIIPIDDQEKTNGEFDQNQLKEIKEKIDAYINENKLNKSLKTTLTESGLIITILDRALFDSGSAVVKKESITLAKEISQLLVTDPPRRIVIAGHTDNIPIKNHDFRSNWELSAQRSINFMELLLQNEKLDPTKFSQSGFGEFQPVASNDTNEGRAKNRRVEVKILPFGE